MKSSANTPGPSSVTVVTRCCTAQATSGAAIDSGSAIEIVMRPTRLNTEAPKARQS